MIDLQNLRPRALKKNPNGTLYLPLNFESYEELGSLICQLSTSLQVFGKLSQQCNNVPADYIGQSIESISKVLSMLLWRVYDDLKLFDELPSAEKD